MPAREPGNDRGVSGPPRAAAPTGRIQTGGSRRNVVPRCPVYGPPRAAAPTWWIAGDTQVNPHGMRGNRAINRGPNTAGLSGYKNRGPRNKRNHVSKKQFLIPNSSFLIDLISHISYLFISYLKYVSYLYVRHLHWKKDVDKRVIARYNNFR